MASVRRPNKIITKKLIQSLGLFPVRVTEQQGGVWHLVSTFGDSLSTLLLKHSPSGVLLKSCS